MGQAIPLTPADAEQALRFISPDRVRDDWVRIGMALKSEFGDAGFELFDSWSAAGASYDKANIKSTWRSIKPSGGTSIGTLVKLAKDAGWQPTQQALTPEQRKQLAKEQEARRQQREREAVKDKAEREAWYERVASMSLQLQTTVLRDEGRSGYLQRKQVGAFGLQFVQFGMVWLTHLEEQRIELITGRVEVSAFFERRDEGLVDRERVSFMYLKRGTIAVPLRDVVGKLWSYQFINEQGTKLFPKLGRKKGLFHWVVPDEALSGHMLREAPPVLALAEGYSTAVSIHQATGWPVAVAFDAGNMKTVAKRLREVYADSRMVICGDNDSHNEKNAGLQGATAAAEAVGGVAVVPQFAEAVA